MTVRVRPALLAAFAALPLVIVACREILAPGAAARTDAKATLINPSGRVVVYPDSMRGWVFYNDQTGVACTTPTACRMVQGPTGQPLGSGSAELADSLSTDGKALILADYNGTRFDQITDLHYSTYRQTVNAGNNLAIALQFNVDYDLSDAANGYQGRLVFEPYQGIGGNVPQNTWQSWDAKAGKWWGTRSTVTKNNVSVANSCVQATPCTWTQVLAAFPNVGVHNTYGAVVLKAGSGWAGFRGNVDSLVIGVAGVTTTFDFELSPPISPNPPAIPDNPNVPDDSAYLIPSGTGGEGLYRRLMIVQLNATATGQQFQNILTTYGGTVVAGFPSLRWYILQLSDPGATMAAVYARINALETSAGVAFASGWPRTQRRPYTQSVLPSDGTGLLPGMWMSDTASATWGMRAIRAPQAWGCQTGLEPGVTPWLSFLELAFTSQDDLAESTISHAPLPLLSPIAVPADTADANKWHGAAVVGMAVARGNNGHGIAGVAWRAKVTVHTDMGTNNFANRFIQHSVVGMLNSVRTDSARVVNVSIGWQADAASDSLAFVQLKLTRNALAAIVSAAPQKLWVKSMENVSGQKDLATDSLALARIDMFATALMLVRRDSASFAKRILLVGGIERVSVPNENREVYLARANSLRVTGQVDLLAPADDISALGVPGALDPAHAGDVVRARGNSFAAPLVTGTAALLLLRDPTLSTAALRDLLVQGSSWPRRDKNSGATVSGMMIDGVPLLDAYGSLATYANSHFGSALCGNDVGFVQGGSPGLPELRFFRSLIGGIEVLPRGVDEAWGDYSAAQGGRRISMWLTRGAPTYDDVFRTYDLGVAGWTYSDQVPKPDSVNRYYLERDTAYVTGDHFSSSLSVEIRGPNAQSHSYTTSGLFAALPPGSSSQFQSANVSPNASYFVAEIGWSSGSTCANLITGHAVVLVPLSNTEAPLVLDDSRRDGCTGATLQGRGIFDTYGAWRDDGRVLWLFHRVLNGSAVQGYVDRRTLGVGAAWTLASSDSIANVSVFALDVTPDGSTLVSVEYRDNACRRVYRASYAPTTADEVAPEQGCDFLTQATLRADNGSNMGGSVDVVTAGNSRRKRGAILPMTVRRR